MKLIESSVELLKQEPGMSGINKMIELAGRTCYKSEANITENSAEEFVKRMVNSRHMAMLEHGTVYLKLPPVIDKKTTLSHSFDYDKNPYSRIVFNGYDADYVTTNLRVLQENGWLDDLKYLCEPTEFHERRITLKFITDRGVSHELVRHRVFSFAQESTRYCNYSKDKFGKELTFIIPSWLDIPEGTAYWHDGICYRIQRSDNPEDFLSIKSGTFGPLQDDLAQKATSFLGCLDSCTRTYFKLINMKCKPQEARQVLPNALKTEIVMTGFASDWREFFDKRLFEKTGRVHPMMLKLATEAKQLLFEADLWSYIMSFPSKFD